MSELWVYKIDTLTLVPGNPARKSVCAICLTMAGGERLTVWAGLDMAHAPTATGLPRHFMAFTHTRCDPGDEHTLAVAVQALIRSRVTTRRTR